MNAYIIRLMSCGISAHDAYMITLDFVKNYSTDDLEEFIKSIEANGNVANV